MMHYMSYMWRHGWHDAFALRDTSLRVSSVINVSSRVQKPYGSVFNIKYLKQKQSTQGTYDFEKVLCFVLYWKKTQYLDGTL